MQHPITSKATFHDERTIQRNTIINAQMHYQLTNVMPVSSIRKIKFLFQTVSTFDALKTHL